MLRLRSLPYLAIAAFLFVILAVQVKRKMAAPEDPNDNAGLDSRYIELKKNLSSRSEVLFPGDQRFKDSLARWSNLNVHQPDAIVKITNGRDAVVAIKFGIEKNIPFRASSGGHGLHSTIKKGFVIDFSLYNDVQVDTKRKEITIQAGALNKKVYDKLYEVKHVTSLAGGNTIGIIPALLGGGLSGSEAYFGLISDNLIKANIITRSGEQLTVSENSKYKDLFWGIRGGGQKLGIVTEVTLKIYPHSDFTGRNDGNVTSIAMAFKPESIEAVTEAWGNGRADTAFSWLFMNNPDLGGPAPLVTMTYYGSPDKVNDVLEPFEKLEPIFQQVTSVAFNHVNDGVDPFCFKGDRKTFMSIGLDKLYPEHTKKAWDKYVKFIKDNSDFAAMTTVLVEMSSISKSQNHPKTAYPHRSSKVWASAIPWWTNPANDKKALEWGKEMRGIYSTCTPDAFPVYSGTSTGKESAASLWGSDQNRRKLQCLKCKYDPTGIYGWGNFVDAYKWPKAAAATEAEAHDDEDVDADAGKRNICDEYYTY